ncbi:hypothetical protein WVI01_02540 [Weissella viridescens]|uniref:Uncharacterized protein n=1 Tax=Weissella viridescens TaxID=1629 RepID=A0A0R2HB72_WEIVI|nr:hypothetical protein [Weissella viridescens]KRN46986.1 hypothetical protein IV50_GL000253 [Weissella viridescens]GEA94331.1 hypothetical protein WVI01_02540 [Weissella viridescens]SUP59166.1 Uncharacterised protein [Weissella viridescens]
MSKKFKVIVSLAVAFLVVVGSVAVIGANSNHKETMAQSSSSARPVAKQRTHKKVVAKPAVKTTATKTSVDAVTPAETQTAEVTQVATTQNTNEQNQTEPVTSQTVAPAGQAQATSVSTAATTPVTTPVTPQPAVPFEKDAQGNASQAVVDYAQQNGLDLNGLQVGTIASESGSGYDVMIRDKKLAEQGQGDGVLNEYHVDKNGVVTPK